MGSSNFSLLYKWQCSLGLLVFSLVIEPQSVLASQVASTSRTPISSSKSDWNNLSKEQQTALAPLATEWNSLDSTRKKKWLGIAEKYQGMKPEEQKRVQERIVAWVKLSPEQRMLARENFIQTSNKTAEQKSAQWQQYQQLSDEEKQKLATEVKPKVNGASAKPDSKRGGTVLPPLKQGPASIPESNATSQTLVSKVK